MTSGVTGSRPERAMRQALSDQSENVTKFAQARSNSLMWAPSTALSATAEIGRVVELMRLELRASSRRKYDAALAQLAAFLGVPNATDALAHLVRAGPVSAHDRAFAWRRHMEADGLSAATVAQRLAALHKGWELMQRLGLVSWPLRVKRPRPTRLKDTRGPGIAAVRKIFDTAAREPGVRGKRDIVILSLLFVLGLRRSEVAALGVDDVDLAGKRIRIRGKGRDDYEWFTLPDVVVGSLSGYLHERGAMAGEPLMCTHDRRARGRAYALTDNGVYRVVRALGRDAGIETAVSPHRLRHTAITVALDGTSGDVRRVRHFSRHAKLETVLAYDDARLDVGGEIAGLVAAAVGERRLRAV